MPLFRARLIGLGFDAERELVLIELRERAADEDDDDDDDERDADAERRRGRGRLRGAHLRDACAGARHGGARRRGRGRRPSAVPAVRPADGPGRAPVSSLELTPDASSPPRSSRRARGRRPHALLVERDVPRRGAASTASRCRRSTSPGAANGRCGTSPRARCATARSRRTSCRDALGWDIVPVTILRDGPLGEGAVQRFVEHDPDEHYFTLLDGHEDRFREFAVFDVLANNTDRKGGHCLHDEVNDVIVGIDHGLTLPPRVEAPHRDLGLRGGAAPGRGRRRRVPRGRRAARRVRCTTGSRRCSPTSSSRPSTTAPEVLLEQGLPYPATAPHALAPGVTRG